jgi:Fe(3+) dicitrate transport protein
VRFLFPVIASVLLLILVMPKAGLASGMPDTVEPSTTDAPSTTAGRSNPEPEVDSEASEILDQLMVTGGAEAVEKIPGSAHFLGEETLRQQNHSDAHRILRQVPGVNLQEEDGYGLRPNIGMRGTGVERSQKITLLEDGVLIAPAPYAAPAAYYVPTAGRMESLEVRKGSSSIRQGPHTVGGVVNFLSSAIPTDLGGRLLASIGQDDTLRLHANTGGSRERLGWLVETFQFDTDGFKQLDGGGPTGVRLEDYLGKVRLNSRASASVYQALELKLGKTLQFGEETYLGLTDSDFARTPLRRYAASQEDRIDTDHEQFQLRYFLMPTPRVNLIATAYRNDFFRNWHKLQSVAGESLGDVLADPAAFPEEIALLRGELDDQTGGLKIRNNRRTYESEGIETVVGWDPGGTGRHRWEFGVRVHRDEEDRFQEEDAWNMVEGRMALSSLGRPGSQSNRIDRAEAIALFLRDEVEFGRWSVSPGLRFESIDYERLDFGKQDPGREETQLEVQRNGIDELIPGIAVGYQPSSRWNLFVGAHRGFAPPGPGQDPETEAEESLNWEAGFRFRQADLAVQAVAFYNDYDNILGRDTLSTGGEGSGQAFNGGAVEVSGLEGQLSFDLGAGRRWPVAVPIDLTYTFTRAEFLSSFETDFPDWAPSVEAGDELPYLPEHQAALSVGLRSETCQLALQTVYMAAMRTTAGSGPIPDGEGTDEHLVVDLTLSHRLPNGLRGFVEVRNLFDEVYIAARRPAGVRPGLPRTVSAGVAWDF